MPEAYDEDGVRSAIEFFLTLRTLVASINSNGLLGRDDLGRLASLNSDWHSGEMLERLLLGQRNFVVETLASLKSVIRSSALKGV